MAHPGSVWIPGRWDWHTIQWRWTDGYETKAKPGYRWRAARWELNQDYGVYVLVDGAWIGTDPVSLRRTDGTTVVNGCGPEWSTWLDEADDGTRIADQHVYVADGYDRNSPGYVVDFRDACNLHDAGYEGCGPSNPLCPSVVHDTINNRDIDYSQMSRKTIDDQFLADMRTLCTQMIALRDGVQVEQTADDASYAATGVEMCRHHGDRISWGAKTMYKIVRTYARSSFKDLGGLRSSE